jgi:hypothetical protein
MRREQRDVFFPEEGMDGLFDHRQEPREVGGAGGIGVRKFHAAARGVDGGACHDGDVCIFSLQEWK